MTHKWKVVCGLFGAIAVVAISVPAIRHVREEAPPPRTAVRLSFAMPPGVEPGWGDETLDAAISPDATAVVFVATHLAEGAGEEARAGVRQLWRRALDQERAEPIPGTQGARFPAFKQTGNVLAFFADERLKYLTLDDGSVHDLGEAPSPAGVTWLRDGSLVFAAGTGAPIRRIRSGTIEAVTTLAPDDLAHAHPVAISGTDDVVYVAVRTDGRRIVRLVADGDDRDLAVTSGHAALVGGHLLHVRDGVLLAYPWNPETGALAARGVPIGLNAGVSASGRSQFAASPRLLLYAPSAPRPHELTWLDESGARQGTIGDAGNHWQVRLSPDDRTAAVTTQDPLLRGLDIVLLPADGPGDPRQLTLALAAETDPVWSPDGARVLFRSMEGGAADLFAKRAHAPDAPNEPILRSPLEETPTDWRGAEILFHARGAAGFDIFAARIDTGAAEPVAATPFNETGGRWSPDGTWIAYVSDESGRPDVYARHRDGTRVRVSFGGGTRPRWTGDGRALIFTRGAQVMRAGVEGRRFAPAQVLFEAPGIRDFDVGRRSNRLLALLPVRTADHPVVSAVWNWTALTRSDD